MLWQMIIFLAKTMPKPQKMIKMSRDISINNIHTIRWPHSVTFYLNDIFAINYFKDIDVTADNVIVLHS